MEALEEVMGPSKDLSSNNYIVKGKRTKRQRPQSPIPFTITPTTLPQYSSSSGGTNNEDHGLQINNINNSSPSSAGSQLFDSLNLDDDDNNINKHDYDNNDNNNNNNNNNEENEAAESLILLSRGHFKESFWDHDQYNQEPSKFNSKKFIEIANGGGNGKGGIYVYECKTCRKTFPSFQALGGHRASHKKPKLTVELERRSMMDISDDQDEYFPPSSKNNYHRSNFNKPSPISPISPHLTTPRDSNSSKSSPKMHECSYCGAEFITGQALGGHMRRHRGMILGLTSNTTPGLPSSPLSTSPAIDLDHTGTKSQRVRTSLTLSPLPHDSSIVAHNKACSNSEDGQMNVRQAAAPPSSPATQQDKDFLSLDLNLPAALSEVDHQKESSTHGFASKIELQNQHQQLPQEQKQQKQLLTKKDAPLVLSTTKTLLDCQN